MQTEHSCARMAIEPDRDVMRPAFIVPATAEAPPPTGARAPGAKRRVGARKEVEERAIGRAEARISSARPVAKTTAAESAVRVHRGVDFLKVSFWLDRVGDRFSEFLAHLKAVKDGIQATEEQEFAPIGFDRHDAQFNLARTGTRFFPYRLVSGDVTLLLADKPGTANMPTARLEIGSITSQTRLLAAIDDVKQLFASLYTIILKENIAELHMAADFIGVDLRDLDLSNMDKWITKGIHFGVFHEHRVLTGVTIGKGDLMLRCYDKAAELKRATHKQDVFARLWGVPRFDDFPVTRVEYQMRRPVLKNFFEKETGGGESVFDLTNLEFLLKSLSSLWKYCTGSWSRFHSTVVDRKNKHQSRAVLAAFWEQVKDVVWDGLMDLERGRAQPHKDIERLIKQASGILMSVTAFFLQDADFLEKENLSHVIDSAREIVALDLYSQFESNKYEFDRRMKEKRNCVFTNIGEDCLQDVVPF